MPRHIEYWLYLCRFLHHKTWKKKKKKAARHEDSTGKMHKSLSVEEEGRKRFEKVKKST